MCYSKPKPKTTASSLFADDDDDDLFGSANKPSPKPPQTKVFHIYISDYEYGSMHTLIIEIVMIFDKRFLAAFSHNHMFVAGMSVL